MIHTPSILNSVRDLKPCTFKKPNWCAAHEFVKFATQAPRIGELKSAAPFLKPFATELAPGVQQDAHEFLTLLLENFNTSCDFR